MEVNDFNLKQNFKLHVFKCILLFQAGFGLFQYFLFFVLGLGLAADSVEVFVIAYVLPSAEKELCMDDSRKGWLGMSIVISFSSILLILL